MLGIWTVVAVLITLVASVITGLLALQKIGGFNGDVLGAAEQLAEIGILLLIAAIHSSIPWWHA